MFPMEFQEAELAYRREHLTNAFRAGAGHGVTATRRRHHLIARKHDRRG